MSTNSRIGIVKPNGSIEHVYCHWDGYPSYVGKMLLEHYTDRNKVEALMKLGNLSMLNKDIGTKHSFEKHNDPLYKDMCLAYGRDRNEKGMTGATPSRDEYECIKFAREQGAEYIYLFDLDGTWKFTGTYNNDVLKNGFTFVPLTLEDCEE